MRQRSISAVGVVIVGIVPALFGGPIFAVILALICLIGLREYHAMARLVDKQLLPLGVVALIGFALVAALDGREYSLLGVCAFAVGAPLILGIFRADLDGAFTDWAHAAAGSFYLGIPLFAAIATRDISGAIHANWLSETSDWLAISWNSHPRGLAWVLFVIVVTWLSDTGAYLVGRATGRHPLIPRISPKKTIEGLAGGIACASATGLIASSAFGLDLPWWAAIGAGVVIGAVGVIGDLAESLLKRQAGVKDSGALIPGHGGMLDRIDSLLFAWTAGLFVATLMDRWV